MQRSANVLLMSTNEMLEEILPDETNGNYRRVFQ